MSTQIATNQIPYFSNVGSDMIRRVKGIPFRQVYYNPDEGMYPVKDLDLMKKMETEKEGILAWLVEGAIEYYKEGLKVPEIVKQRTKEIFEEQDLFGDWLSQYFEKDPKAWISTQDLYKSWNNYCWQRYIKNPITNIMTFGRVLSKRPGVKYQKRQGLSGYMGFRLKI